MQLFLHIFSIFHSPHTGIFGILVDMQLFVI